MGDWYMYLNVKKSIDFMNIIKKWRDVDMYRMYTGSV